MASPASPVRKRFVNASTVRLGLLCLLAGLMGAAPVSSSAGGPVNAQPIATQAAPVVAENAVDKVVRDAMARRRIPGVSVAVVRDGKPVLLKGYGVADQERNTPAAADTVFQLASVTKQFTATGIMALVQDGKLKLDAPIAEVLPGLPATWKPVTVRHLLDHTSGIHSYTSLPAFAINPGKVYAQTELLKLVRDLPLDFQPGDRLEYNNTGYFLLGMIIEKVSGKSYGEFLRERIFAPLGMEDTRVNDVDAALPRRAIGYSMNGNELTRAAVTHPSQPFAAGALISTVTDMVKWDAALYTERILKKQTLEQMWTSTRLNDGKEPGYGFGWSTGTVQGHRVVAHGGGITGFSTNITRFPEDRLTVIVLTNLANLPAEGLARSIAELYLPDLAPKSIADADPKTTAKLFAEMKAIIAGMARKENYTDEAQQALFPNRLKEGGTALKRLGELRSFDLLERRVEGEITVHRYRLSFEGMVLVATYSTTPEGKIAGILLGPG